MKKTAEYTNCLIAVTVDERVALISGPPELVSGMDGEFFNDNCSLDSEKSLPTVPGVYFATVEFWFEQGYFEGYRADGESEWEYILTDIRPVVPVINLTEGERFLINRLIEFARNNDFFETDTDDEEQRQEYGALLPIAESIEVKMDVASCQPQTVTDLPIPLSYQEGIYRCPHCGGTRFTVGVVGLNRLAYESIKSEGVQEGHLTGEWSEENQGDYQCDGCGKSVTIREEMFS